MKNVSSTTSDGQSGKVVEQSPSLIDDSEGLVGAIDELFSNRDFSDVTFLIEGERIYAHRLILAARSEYFRAMLYGGLKESVEAEHELKGTNLLAFCTVLKFIYSAKVDLRTFKVDELLEILHLAHEYRLTKLQHAVTNYLETKLNIDNVFNILETSTLLLLDDLSECCLRFADRNATKVLVSQKFLTLPQTMLVRMLKRDSFFAVEIDIFHAMCKWIQAQPLMEATPLEMLIKSLVSKNCLRLHLMSTKELLTTVRHSALFDTNSPTLDAFILDAIDWKMQYSKLSNFRGALLADENVVTVKLGAVVVAGVNTEKLLSREAHNSGGGSALTRHKIGTKEGIVVKLGQPYTINTIVLQQPDWQVGSAYSCFIEASMDRRDWVNVAHHVDYQCTSFQTLIFDARLVRFIRIVGSHNLEKHKHFSLVSFEALYSTKNAKMLNGTSLVFREKI